MKGDGIQLRPNQFKDYLKHIGFTFVKTLIDPGEGSEKAIYIYKKGEKAK